MSVQFDSSRNRWVVRWYEAGRQRPALRPSSAPRASSTLSAARPRPPRGEAAAARLAGELARLRARVETIEDQLPDDARATGVYSYATTQGVRWRIAVKQPDGTRHDAPGISHARGGMPGTRPAHAAAATGSRRVIRVLLATVARREAALPDRRLARGPRDPRPQAPPPPPRPRTRRRDHASSTSATGWRDDRAATAGAISAKTINNARAALSSVTRRRHPPGPPAAQPLPVRRPAPDRASRARLPPPHRDRPLPRRLPCSLPTTRRTAHRHRRPHLRSARRTLSRTTTAASNRRGDRRPRKLRRCVGRNPSPMIRRSRPRPDRIGRRRRVARLTAAPRAQKQRPCAGRSNTQTATTADANARNAGRSRRGCPPTRAAAAPAPTTARRGPLGGAGSHRSLPRSAVAGGAACLGGRGVRAPCRRREGRGRRVR